MKKTALLILTLLTVLFLSLQTLPVLAEDKPNESTMGKEAAAEVEKDNKLIKDPEINKRVQTIGKAVADVANAMEVPSTYGNSSVVKFDYTFKVIDDKEVNAFCLPGGYIYVDKGLLDFVQSDHELAGVLAHEVTHAAHHHMIALLKEQQKLDNKIAMLLLAGLVGKMPSDDLGNIVMGAQLFRIAKVNGYGIEAEKDADIAAIKYMQKAGYNPVGMLTFLERLSKKPELVQWGIYQNHPDTGLRAQVVEEALRAQNIAINRREVTNSAKASTRQTTVDGKQVVELLLGDTVLDRTVSGNTGSSTRFKQTADRLNELLDDDLQMRDIKLSPDLPVVLVRGEPLIEIAQGDAALMKKDPMAVAKDAAEAVRRVLWQQMVDTMR